jgi:hypothetical protein
VGEEPSHVEDAEKGRGHAGDRLADLGLGELQNHHPQEQSGHEARRIEGVADEDDQRQGGSRQRTEQAVRRGSLLTDEVVELVYGEAVDADDDPPSD